VKRWSVISWLQKPPIYRRVNWNRSQYDAIVHEFLDRHSTPTVYIIAHIGATGATTDLYTGSLIITDGRSTSPVPGVHWHQLNTQPYSPASLAPYINNVLMSLLGHARWWISPFHSLLSDITGALAIKVSASLLPSFCCQYFEIGNLPCSCYDMLWFDIG